MDLVMTIEVDIQSHLEMVVMWTLIMEAAYILEDQANGVMPQSHDWGQYILPQISNKNQSICDNIG